MSNRDPEPSSRPSRLRTAVLLQESLRDLVRILRSRDRARASRHGLSATQSDALLLLSKAGPMTVTALGERLHLEKSTASRIVKGLLGIGLVRKRSPTSDERKVILQLTEQGLRLARKLLNDYAKEDVELLESLDPESRGRLPILLGELTGTLVALGRIRGNREG